MIPIRKLSLDDNVETRIKNSVLFDLERPVDVHQRASLRLDLSKIPGIRGNII
jgi:hypothetical protein